MPEKTVILDPYMGSGSTGCVCVQENVGYVGIDNDPNSYLIAEHRINHHKKLRDNLLFDMSIEDDPGAYPAEAEPDLFTD